MGIIRDEQTAMTCYLVITKFLPYINRVYATAGLRFWLKSCKSVNAIDNEEGESKFDRRSLTDQSALNVFIISKGEMGYTSMYSDGRGYIMLSEMDVDSVRWNLGRLANTLAHEIGHILGLEHNPRRGFLMYPVSDSNEGPLHGQEEKISSDEIMTIREWALRQPVPWDFGHKF